MLLAQQQLLPDLYLTKMIPKEIQEAIQEHNTSRSNRGPRKGRFTPRHPEKYVGNVNDIIYRSSWELSFMNFLDNNTSVVQWGSEIIPIPYRKPTTGRIHKYYPDFWVKYRKKDGTTVQEVIEVKPEKETKQPTTRGKKKKTQLYEAITWEINKAKWHSAKLFCDKYGMKFRIFTENKIFR
jgi:hypothetical protein